MSVYLLYVGAAAITYLGIVAIVYVIKLENARDKISELEYELSKYTTDGLTVEIDDLPVPFTPTDKGWGSGETNEIQFGRW